VPDVVLLDLNFTPGRIDGAEGLAALDLLRAPAPSARVIALTAYADVPLAVEALKRGAGDFITKPWDNARLVAAVESALARRAAVDAGAARDARPDGRVAADARAEGDDRQRGPTEANVMVLGENGVGKELVARAIHQASRARRHLSRGGHGRAAGIDLRERIVRPPQGRVHRRGARPRGALPGGARRHAVPRRDRQHAAGAQAKLLTALERREVTPVGADKPEADRRAHRQRHQPGRGAPVRPAVFRPDLLFRLNTIVIRVPPLRERREDIPLLLRPLPVAVRAQYERPARCWRRARWSAVRARSWPGNVRALRHACERAVILAPGEYTLADFGWRAARSSPPAGAQDRRAPETRRAGTRRHRAALAKAQGNISHAAKMLGVSRAALYRKLEKHGI
jgi:DNA-binding NtrC family response regulator